MFTESIAHLFLATAVLFTGAFLYSICWWLFSKNIFLPALVFWTILVLTETEKFRFLFLEGGIVFVLIWWISIVYLPLLILPAVTLHFMMKRTPEYSGCWKYYWGYFSLLPVHLLCFSLYFKVFSSVFDWVGKGNGTEAPYAVVLVFSPTLASFVFWGWHEALISKERTRREKLSSLKP
jgi:hypothetical protein